MINYIEYLKDEVNYARVKSEVVQWLQDELTSDDTLTGDQLRD